MNEQVLPWFLLLILLPLVGAFICIGTKNRTTDYVASLFTGLTALVGLWMVGEMGLHGREDSPWRVYPSSVASSGKKFPCSAFSLTHSAQSC